MNLVDAESIEYVIFANNEESHIEIQIGNGDNDEVFDDYVYDYCYYGECSTKWRAMTIPHNNDSCRFSPFNSFWLGFQDDRQTAMLFLSTRLYATPVCVMRVPQHNFGLH